jgi:hypothetical protein
MQGFRERVLTVAAVGLTLGLGLSAVLAEGLGPEKRTLDFQLGAPLTVDVTVGDLKVGQLTIARDDKNLLEQLLPSRGGQTRWSYLETTLFVANPSGKAQDLSARVRLLDANDAVIDEFEFDGRVWRGKARALKLRRLTLNYVIPLIKKVEVALIAEP